ncbi:MAG: class I SAM-dependent methyltransferase [Actinomycetota bacterium]
MDQRQIYARGADRYHRLVAAEDADGRLGPALARALGGASNPGGPVVEIGAGTGRVTDLLVGLGLTVIATEPSPAMVTNAIDRGAGGPGRPWCLAEAAALPVRDASCVAAVAGWVFGHQIHWQPNRWRAEVAHSLDECDRVTGDGTVVVIETLGTGHAEPTPPPELVAYYDWLVHDAGFQRAWIRTDYAFPTVDEAAAAAGDFFGSAFAETVRANGWSRIPECTGIWTRGPSL